MIKLDESISRCMSNFGFMDKNTPLNRMAAFALTPEERLKLEEQGLIKTRTITPKTRINPSLKKSDEIGLRKCMEIIGAKHPTQFYNWARRRDIHPLEHGKYSRAEVEKKHKENPYVSVMDRMMAELGR